MASKVLWQGAGLKLNIGRQTIFDNADIAIHDGEKVALVGRNGCGKSTLLRAITGEQLLAEGNISVTRGVRIAALSQEFTLDPTMTVGDCVRSGADYIESLLTEYESNPTSSRHDELEHLLTLHDAWNLAAKQEDISSRLHLPPNDRQCGSLSGGEQRRVALARAIISSPDLLLLDEPTNHLDVETITWIEDFLNSFKGACLFVTHDRYFLDRLATRVVELSNGKFFSCAGSYADFLAAKAEREYAEDQMESKRQSFLRSEVDWVRRSPKARLRRNLGRLRRYNDLADQHAPIRSGDIELVIPPAFYIGNKVIDIENLSCSFGEKLLFKDFNFEFTPGRKLGIVGPNGAGKTTLVRLLTGQMSPQTGSVKIADNVRFNYIDQNRVVLNDSLTVVEELGEGSEAIVLGNEKISIWGYLKRFLFEDERINTKIKYLSGGERSRLALAKVLKNGGNFLVLDEPTNDLDLTSLRLLEESIANYDGCVLTVSHDRYFLNRVCDGIISIDGQGNITYTLGDYDNYLAKRSSTPVEAPKVTKAEPKVAPPKQTKVKLSFKQRQRLSELEVRIPELESRTAEIENTFSDPDFFRKFGEQSTALQTELDEAKSELEEIYLEWMELSEIAEGK